MPSAASIFAAYASISAFSMLIQTMFNRLVPRQVQQYVLNAVHHYFKSRENNATIVIEDRDGMSANEVYDAAETYLCTKIWHNIEHLKIMKHPKDTDFSIRFAQRETVPDFYQGIELEWRFVHKERKGTSKVIGDHLDDTFNDSDKRYFKLRFDRKHKATVLNSYVPFVMETAKVIKSEKKVIKLHTLPSASSYHMWDSINLEHPSTFETLAMEPGQKQCIIDDLDRFLRRKDFYRKVGRAWKRGYLLYGPPGTGKSSLIAAMANYLKFDIYDLDLANVKHDSDLRKLLLRTANRSILVIEDIDCTVELPDRNGPTGASSDKHADSHLDLLGSLYLESYHSKSKFTLAGLLNFIDGLWSSCGDERIIIFTTNNKDKLDPALLRPGRMDMHVHMSYLTPTAFRLLASTYLNINDHHPLFPEIEDLIQGMNVTPAEVAEQLMMSDDVDISIHGLISFLKYKKEKDEPGKDEGCEHRADEGDVQVLGNE